jgi:hypothetical protein
MSVGAVGAVGAICGFAIRFRRRLTPQIASLIWTLRQYGAILNADTWADSPPFDAQHIKIIISPSFVLLS